MFVTNVFKVFLNRIEKESNAVLLIRDVRQEEKLQVNNKVLTFEYLDV
jgi:hypothetical protein